MLKSMLLESETKTTATADQTDYLGFLQQADDKSSKLPDGGLRGETTYKRTSPETSKLH